MKHQVDTRMRDPGASAITLSEDGYVRLTLATFLNVPLSHLLSGLDEDTPVTFREGASLSEISGYTEWVSTTVPAITIGWDWRLDTSQGQLCCVRVSEPRSNVMLLDSQQRDLGPAKTAMLLETAIDATAWQDEALRAVGTRYA